MVRRVRVVLEELADIILGVMITGATLLLNDIVGVSVTRKRYVYQPPVKTQSDSSHLRSENIRTELDLCRTCVNGASIALDMALKRLVPVLEDGAESSAMGSNASFRSRFLGCVGGSGGWAIALAFGHS
jgi:hypothetical protein